ncbi:glycosyltransferase family 2 protein [Lacticaseibacillus daqingensis]|uniref:glycosyltransferase family 2 protein n=1 Tax=Lacticaseibacillus daqingensis TaxID=2486014 RepID=UPI000F7B8514|nr:glycosyltransferase [Lacticaseibacillus daqingensis]
MKLLSVCVPCYNSAAYMNRCIDALLVSGPAVEVVIVDDGSSDGTGAIADQYAAAYPDQVQAVHQVNGGHGQAINAGLAAATGRFFKVVDSDDWLAPDALHALMAKLTDSAYTAGLDMLICNFIYDKVNATHKKTMQFRHLLPTDRAFTWTSVHLPAGKYFLMHAVIYRTAMLKAAHLRLPAHTFYEDNLYVFYPLPHVKRMRYLDLDLYHYYIGRADQSVNEDVLIGRIDQQLRVNRAMIDFYQQTDFTDPALARYMRSYLSIITGISSILLLRAKTPAALAQKQALWHYMQATAPELHTQLRHGVVGWGVNLPGRVGRATSVGVYQALQHVYQFN